MNSYEIITIAGIIFVVIAITIMALDGMGKFNKVKKSKQG